VEKGDAADRTRHRRRVYAGVGAAVIALVLASLLVDPPAERARRADDERLFEAIEHVDVIDAAPFERLGIDPATYADLQQGILSERECENERRAAAVDGRVEPVEAQRIERWCRAH
jgi:hypothetical protein